MKAVKSYRTGSNGSDESDCTFPLSMSLFRLSNQLLISLLSRESKRLTTTKTLKRNKVSTLLLCLYQVMLLLLAMLLSYSPNLNQYNSFCFLCCPILRSIMLFHHDSANSPSILWPASCCWLFLRYHHHLHHVYAIIDNRHDELLPCSIIPIAAYCVPLDVLLSSTSRSLQKVCIHD